MDTIRNYPLTATALAGGCIVLLIACVVQFHYQAVPTGGDVQVWGGTTVFSTETPAPQSRTGAVATEYSEQFTQTNTIRTFSIATPAQTAHDTSATDAKTALDALLALHATPQATQQATSSNALLNDLQAAYAFIPQGLISLPQASIATKTPAQEELYAYGNEVGSFIQAFEAEHPHESQILTDQLKDRTNTVKNAAVTDLGNALVSLGTQIGNIDPIPRSVVGYHKALADGYVAIGKKLVLVPKAQSDAELLSAVNTYNTTADSFIRSYGALATYLSSAGILFSSADPGSVFTFTPGAGL